MDIKLSFRDFIIVTIIAVVVLSVAFFFLVEKPRLDSIASIRKQQEEALKMQQTARLTLARLQAAKKESAEIEAKLIRLSKKMPEDPELASLIVEIQELATESGMELVSIKPTEPVQAADFSELKLEINMSGYFFDTVDFLYRLDNFSREVKVLSLVLAKGSKELPHLNVALQANAFVLVTGQPAAPAPAALPPAQTAPSVPSEGM